MFPIFKAIANSSILNEGNVLAIVDFAHNVIWSGNQQAEDTKPIVKKCYAETTFGGSYEQPKI